MASVSVNPVGPRAAVQPKAIELAGSWGWMVAMMVVGLLAYYFIGVDQGATSVFGKNVLIHEFVHDSRHYLGFPCH